MYSIISHIDNIELSWAHFHNWYQLKNNSATVMVSFVLAWSVITCEKNSTNKFSYILNFWVFVCIFVNISISPTYSIYFLFNFGIWKTIKCKTIVTMNRDWLQYFYLVNLSFNSTQKKFNIKLCKIVWKMTHDELKQKQQINNTHSNNNDDEFPKAPDGGWGYMVVFGCFFIHIISKV